MQKKDENGWVICDDCIAHVHPEHWHEHRCPPLLRFLVGLHKKNII